MFGSTLCLWTVQPLIPSHPGECQVVPGLGWPLPQVLYCHYPSASFRQERLGLRICGWIGVPVALLEFGVTGGGRCGNLLQGKLPEVSESDPLKDSEYWRIRSLNLPSSITRLQVCTTIFILHMASITFYLMSRLVMDFYKENTRDTISLPDHRMDVHHPRDTWLVMLIWVSDWGSVPLPNTISQCSYPASFFPLWILVRKGVSTQDPHLKRKGLRFISKEETWHKLFKILHRMFISCFLLIYLLHNLCQHELILYAITHCYFVYVISQTDTVSTYGSSFIWLLCFLEETLWYAHIFKTSFLYVTYLYLCTKLSMSLLWWSQLYPSPYGLI